MSARRHVAALLAACLLAAPAAQADDSSPGNLNIKESLAQKVACRGRRKARVCSVAQMRRLEVKFDAAVTLDTTLAFDETTRVSFRLGALTFETTLSGDPKWTRYRKLAEFDLRAAGSPTSAPRDGVVRVRWSSRHVFLTIKATTAALLANIAPREGHQDVWAPVDAAIRFGDGFWFFAGSAYGGSFLRTVNVNSVPTQLVQAKVAYSGQRALPTDDAKAPKLFVDAPVEDSILSTNPVRFTGRATDNRQLGTLVYFIDDGPVQVALLTIDPASGGPTEQQATFSFDAPVPTEGIHTVRLVLTDRGTNEAEASVTFVWAIPRPTLLATGDRFSVVARGGRTFTWGADASGQLGNGSAPESTGPSLVAPLFGAKALAAGLTHTVVLLEDGTVKTVGGNANGQLGNGDVVDLAFPVLITPLTNIVAIAAGNHHSMALRSDGTVWCWGANDLGQVGDGKGATHDTSADAPVPVQVPGLSNVVAIAAGAHLSAAVLSDGTLRGWGDGTRGRLPSSQPEASPVVFGPLGVVEVAVGGTHVLARRADGTVFAWGHRRYGCIGDGISSEDEEPTPKLVAEVGGAVALAASATSCAVLQSDATVVTWGNDDHGQLGTGGGQRATPARISGLRYVLRLASSAQSLSFLAHRADNALLGWGEYVGGDPLAPSPESRPLAFTLPE